MSHPNVLAIIVTWNKKDYVLELLGSLATLDFPHERLHLLVVDNASEDGTADAVEQTFPDVEVLRNTENLGGTGGFNTGLAWGFSQPEGRFDYFWLLDNDVLAHRSTLSRLVEVLERKPDVAVAGSTMMQLDYPWRVNEMGAFVDRRRGTLLLQHHHEVVSAWRNRPVRELLTEKPDLARHLGSVRPVMDVDYVAAASLLIRAPAARAAGLWDDFFIHFDDVEWCLRIARAGHRVVVCSESLIWHLSAAAKVPTWILYYDNRNVLYLLARHGVAGAVPATIRWICLKAAYYALLGKEDLARLHLQAVDDFAAGVKGKKALSLDTRYGPLSEVESVLREPAIRRVLVPWVLDLQETGIQEMLVRARKARADLEIWYLHCPSCPEGRIQLPDSRIITVPRARLRRWLRLIRMQGDFDLVLQSDYRPLPLLSWLGREVLFVNQEGCARRPRPSLGSVLGVGREILRRARRWR